MSDGLLERDQLEVEDHGLVLLSLLGSTATSRTWLAADAADALKVVRRLIGRGEAERASVLSTLSRLAQLRHPGLLSPEPAWVAGTSVWVARPHDPGVSLRRLAAVARLDSRHVVAIGGDVLDGLAAVHAVGVAHGALHPGNILVGLDGRARVVDMGLRASTADGAGSGGVGETGPDRGTGYDIEAVAASLRVAMVQPRRHGAPGRGPHPRPEGLGGLDPILGGPGLAFAGASSAGEARIALYDAAGEPDARTRREIVALVTPLRAVRPIVTPPLASILPRPPEHPRPPRHAAQTAATVPEPHPKPAPVPSPGVREAREAGGSPLTSRGRTTVMGLTMGATALRRRAVAGVRSLWGWSVTRMARLWRRAAALTARPWHLPPGWRISSRRRLMAWLAPLAAVALVAGVAVMLSGRHTGAVATPVLNTPVPSAAAPARSETAVPSTPASRPPSPAAPSVTSPPASPPAPPTAGPIVGLSVSPQGGGGCTVTPGGSCEVQVNVNLEPQQAETTVTFDLLLVNQCTGASSTLLGGSVMAASGFTLVWADAPVVFPSGDPMMLYAVTSSPAHAASPGLALIGSTSAC